MTSMKKRIVDKVMDLFHDEASVSFEIQELRNQPEDHRLVVYAEYPEGRYVIKIASNGFTTAQRVNAWPDLIAEYEKLGCYSPKMRLSRYGRYAEKIIFEEREYVAWEEEFARLPFVADLPDDVLKDHDGTVRYYDGLIEFMGRSAQRHLSGFPGKSGWVRLEPFGEDEETDETTECFRTFDELVRQKYPAYASRWERIRELYEANRAKLAKLYDRLPTSVFQGDWGEGNLLLDDRGHFAGLIDYNLAGEDTVLNIFISFSMFSGMYAKMASEEELDKNELPYLNLRTRNRLIGQMLETFKALRKYYTFAEIEAEAAPMLFKYIMSVEYAQISALEKYVDDHEKLENLFDFIEYELRREDIDFRGAMLGE